MRVVGICGWAGSGKSSVMEYLRKHLSVEGFDVDMIRFIREEIIPKYLGITDKEEIERLKFAPPDVMPPGWIKHMRQAMIDLGKAFKAIDPMCLIKNADKDIARKTKNNQIGIIQNLRTDPEFHHYHKNGLVVLVRRLALQGQRLHEDQETEQSVDKFMDLPPGPVENADLPIDYVLDNDGSLEDLESIVKFKLVPFVEERLVYFLDRSEAVFR